MLIEKKGAQHVYFTDIEINIPACFLDLGLDTFKDNPEAASDYIKPLLQYVAGYIPQDQQKETLLFILATAGMRMIPEQWVNDQVRKLYKFINLDNFRLAQVFTLVQLEGEGGGQLYYTL